ncbi:MAG: 3-hydroxyacyl-ACP dehydratase FabZ family protein [Pirellulaceae bacterium]|jgi:3-hydroxyacyl-[acyl-carrier-protein] dehydratase|nr:3-hydroxyacyl-ACP dehydratase FabZ family protein [Pirellulaceae bacterium]
MRWFWIDRFTEFVSGQRATAVKNISLAELHIDEYSPGHPTMPHSLIVEGLAQTGGLLVGEHNQFDERVVLAKLGRAVFHFPVSPGDQLVYRTEIEDIKVDGAFVKATATVDDRLQAEVGLQFAHLDERFPAEIFEPADFLAMLRLFRLYDVGVTPDGSPLTIPERLLRAESKEYAP